MEPSAAFYAPGLPLNIDTPSSNFIDWLTDGFGVLLAPLNRLTH